MSQSCHLSLFEAVVIMPEQRCLSICSFCSLRPCISKVFFLFKFLYIIRICYLHMRRLAI